MEAPAFMLMFVFARMIPSMCAPTPMSMAPVTCQKTFFARAPFVRVIALLSLIVSLPFTWKMKTSLAPPEMVTLKPFLKNGAVNETAYAIGLAEARKDYKFMKQRRDDYRTTQGLQALLVALRSHGWRELM